MSRLIEYVGNNWRKRQFERLRAEKKLIREKYEFMEDCLNENVEFRQSNESERQTEDTVKWESKK